MVPFRENVSDRRGFRCRGWIEYNRILRNNWLLLSSNSGEVGDTVEMALKLKWKRGKKINIFLRCFSFHKDFDTRANADIIWLQSAGIVNVFRLRFYSEIHINSLVVCSQAGDRWNFIHASFLRVLGFFFHRPSLLWFKCIHVTSDQHITWLLNRIGRRCGKRRRKNISDREFGANTYSNSEWALANGESVVCLDFMRL